MNRHEKLLLTVAGIFATSGVLVSVGSNSAMARPVSCPNNCGSMGQDPAVCGNRVVSTGRVNCCSGNSMVSCGTFDVDYYWKPPGAGGCSEPFGHCTYSDYCTPIPGKCLEAEDLEPIDTTGERSSAGES